MARFDLTDFEWSVIQPLLPTKVRGKKRVDDRRVLNGIFWRLRTGAPKQLPSKKPASVIDLFEAMAALNVAPIAEHRPVINAADDDWFSFLSSIVSQEIF